MNRLNELFAMAGEKPPTAAATATSSSSSSSISTKSTIAQEKDFETTMQLLDVLESEHQNFRVLNSKFRELSAKIMKSVDEDETDQQEFGDTMMKINEKARHFRQLLDELTSLSAKQKLTIEKSALLIKLQQNQNFHFVRVLKTNVDEFNKIITEHQQFVHQRLVRRIKITYKPSKNSSSNHHDNNVISDEEANELATQLLGHGNFESSSSSSLLTSSKQLLSQVLENRQDMLRIERSLRELQMVMNDLSSLINEQDQVFDLIAENVHRAVLLVKHGNEEGLKPAHDSVVSASSGCLIA